MNNKKKGQALLLGGSGFIGQYLSRRLSDNYNIIIYDRFESSDFPTICGNFSSEDDFLRILDDYSIDIVFHLVSTTVPKEDTSDIATELQDNVVPTLRLFEAIKKRPSCRLIFISSGGTIYGEYDGFPHKTNATPAPICGYGMQKFVIEEYLKFYRRRFNIDLRIARVSNPYGVLPNTQRTQGIIPIFLNKLLNQEPITIFGDTVRDYIYIEDVVDALIRFTDYSGSEYCINIGSGQPTSLSKLIDMIERVTEQKFKEIRHEPIRDCDVRANVLDIDNTRRLLSWLPLIDLESGIKRTWAEMKFKGLNEAGSF